uniref:F-box domain-containing protein n=1 Tax=Pygocentrus nattereri TaxID=42514 RepID=A0AAR2K0K6_PYGNA
SFTPSPPTIYLITPAVYQSPPTVYHSHLLTPCYLLKVCLRMEFRGAAPGELKLSHEEFVNDARLQPKTRSNSYTLIHAFLYSHIQTFWCLFQDSLHYLERLPDQLLMHILSFLNNHDICRLGQTSQRFRKVISLCISQSEF